MDDATWATVLLVLSDRDGAGRVRHINHSANAEARLTGAQLQHLAELIRNGIHIDLA